MRSYCLYGSLASGLVMGLGPLLVNELSSCMESGHGVEDSEKLESLTISVSIL